MNELLEESKKLCKSIKSDYGKGEGQLYEGEIRQGTLSTDVSNNIIEFYYNVTALIKVLERENKINEILDK